MRGQSIRLHEPWRVTDKIWLDSRDDYTNTMNQINPSCLAILQRSSLDVVPLRTIELLTHQHNVLTAF